MANNLKIGYKIVKNNMPATAEAAPYLGMAVPVGSLAVDDILNRMVKVGTHMDTSTARFMLNAFFEYAGEEILENTVRISLGDFSIYPAISGIFASEDAAFDATENALYVGASCAQSVRAAIAEIVPEYKGDAADTGSVLLTAVYDVETQTLDTIRGKKAFRVSGANLNVPSAADESIALYDTDLLTKVSDVTVTENDSGQRLTCKLTGTTAVPKGTYKLRVALHGLDPTDPLTIKARKVTVTEAVVLTPTVTGITDTIGNPYADLWPTTLDVRLVGTNLTQSTVGGVKVEYKKPSGETGVKDITGAGWVKASTATYIELDQAAAQFVANDIGTDRNVTFHVTNTDGESCTFAATVGDL